MSETLEQMRDRWSTEGAALDTFHATMGIGYKKCAADLDAYLTRPQEPGRDDWKVPFRRMMDIVCMCGDTFDSVEAFVAHGQMVHDDSDAPAPPPAEERPAPPSMRCVDTSCPIPYEHHVYDMKCASARPAPATPEPATERVALRTLLDAIVSVWGDVENCEECGALAEIGDDSLCAVHRSDKLYRAILAADELLGPCPCGHARSQHHDEDTTKCRECRCEAFNLPPPTAPRETP